MYSHLTMKQAQQFVSIGEEVLKVAIAAASGGGDADKEQFKDYTGEDWVKISGWEFRMELIFSDLLKGMEYELKQGNFNNPPTTASQRWCFTCTQCGARAEKRPKHCSTCGNVSYRYTEKRVLGKI